VILVISIWEAQYTFGWMLLKNQGLMRP
jgi:hypothetical protein